MDILEYGGIQRSIILCNWSVFSASPSKLTTLFRSSAFATTYFIVYNCGCGICDVRYTNSGLFMLGIASYLYVNIKNELSFRIITVIMLMAPMVADYAAMIEGFGEIYPVGEKAWFNGRYLIFVAPLIAFGSTSLVICASKIRRRRILITSAAFVVVVLSYSFVLRSTTRGRKNYRYGRYCSATLPKS